MAWVVINILFQIFSEKRSNHNDVTKIGGTFLDATGMNGLKLVALIV